MQYKIFISNITGELCLEIFPGLLWFEDDSFGDLDSTFDFIGML